MWYSVQELSNLLGAKILSTNLEFIKHRAEFDIRTAELVHEDDNFRCVIGDCGNEHYGAGSAFFLLIESGDQTVKLTFKKRSVWDSDKDPRFDLMDIQYQQDHLHNWVLQDTDCKHAFMKLCQDINTGKSPNMDIFHRRISVLQRRALMHSLRTYKVNDLNRLSDLFAYNKDGSLVCELFRLANAGLMPHIIDHFTQEGQYFTADILLKRNAAQGTLAEVLYDRGELEQLMKPSLWQNRLDDLRKLDRTLPNHIRKALPVAECMMLKARQGMKYRL